MKWKTAHRPILYNARYPSLILSSFFDLADSLPLDVQGAVISAGAITGAGLRV